MRFVGVKGEPRLTHALYDEHDLLVRVPADETDHPGVRGRVVMCNTELVLLNFSKKE